MIATFLRVEAVPQAVLQVLLAPVLRGMFCAPAPGRSVSPDWIAARYSRARPSDVHATGSTERDSRRRSIHGRSPDVV